MKFSVLIDNTPDGQNALEAEHGLSMLAETDGRRILIDTGLSGKFIDNARRMGISLDGLDFCFLSHGHNDHSGGLRRLMETNNDTKVYLSERIFHERYASSRHGGSRDLSTDADTLQIFSGRLVPIKESSWIADGIAAVFTSHDEYPKPVGNIFLTKTAVDDSQISYDISRASEGILRASDSEDVSPASDESEGVSGESLNTSCGIGRPDDFDHEMSMAIVTAQGLIIFSSCSHGGAINIMKSCQDFTGEQRVRAFIGGLHFVDCNHTASEVATFVSDLKTTFPDTQIFTGHCTSDKAKNLLKDSGISIRFFRTGDEFEI